jgi:hypothetical protein
MDPNDPTNPFRKCLAGGLTGMTASTLTYPLDLIRTHLSVSVDGASVKPSIAGCAKELYSKGGFLGMYKGLGATLVGIIPYVGIKMASFDILKTAIDYDKDHPNFTALNLSVGAFAGFISVTLTYPTDLLRRRMQLRG